MMRVNGLPEIYQPRTPREVGIVEHAVGLEQERIRTAIDRRCRNKGHTGWGTCLPCRELADILLDAPRVELAVASEGP